MLLEMSAPVLSVPTAPQFYDTLDSVRYQQGKKRGHAQTAAFEVQETMTRMHLCHAHGACHVSIQHCMTTAAMCGSEE